MLIQNQVGPLAGSVSMSQGSQPAQRAGQLGDLIISNLHGRYYEQNYRKNLFHAANQSAVTTSAGITTAYVGCSVANPNGSGVNAVITRVGFGIIVANTAGTMFGIVAGYSATSNVTAGGAITPQAGFYGSGATPRCTANASPTLPANPVITHILASGGTGALTVVVGNPMTTFELDGSLILPPGAYCGIYTNVASGASGFMGSISWVEIPL